MHGFSLSQLPLVRLSSGGWLHENVYNVVTIGSSQRNAGDEWVNPLGGCGTECSPKLTRQCRRAEARACRPTTPAPVHSRACPRCAWCQRNDGRFESLQTDRNNLRLTEFPRPVFPPRATIARTNRSR